MQSHNANAHASQHLQPQLPRSGSQTVLTREVSAFASSACLELQSVLHLAFTYAARMLQDLTDGMSSRTQTPISQGWQFVDKYTGGDPDHIGIVAENEAARPNAQAGDLTQTPAGLLKTSWQNLQHSTRKMMYLWSKSLEKSPVGQSAAAVKTSAAVRQSKSHAITHEVSPAEFNNLTLSEYAVKYCHECAWSA